MNLHNNEAGRKVRIVHNKLQYSPNHVNPL